VQYAASNQGYAGDLTPRDAWSLLSSDKSAVLVDCRSLAEWSFVGVPDLSSIGKRTAFVAWQHWSATPSGPQMTPNARFTDEVQSLGASRDAPIVFICRSGARSRSAAIAMTQHGYSRCFNLAGGFEGGHDADRHRGHAEGWKATGLPWVQE
jgi:rhodanese-related sulfurtransferase